MIVIVIIALAIIAWGVWFIAADVSAILDKYI